MTYAMKYIRTKYGTIHEIVGIVNQPNRPHDGWLIDSRGYNVIPEDVARQSDDIEELFDEVVCARKSDGKHFTYASKELISYGLLHDDDCEIYGAIWTKRGLTYVAQMNQDGGWRLVKEL